MNKIILISSLFNPRTSLCLFPLCFKGTAYKAKRCNIKAFGNVSKQINYMVKNKKCNKSATAPNQLLIEFCH